LPGLRCRCRPDQLLVPLQGLCRSATTAGSLPTPGAALPGTLASPRTRLALAGCPELSLGLLLVDHSLSWVRQCASPGLLDAPGWGEIPPLFGGLGRDKTAQSARSVPELSNTTVGGWQTPCSGDPDRTASPCRRSRFQNSPVRSATVVTATDLAQGNLKAERGRPAISSLVGDRHGHMDWGEIPPFATDPGRA